MRDKIVAGNWKMNKNLEEALQLVNELKVANVDLTPKIIVIPSFPFINSIVNTLENSPIKVGAQNCSTQDSGAYTGEVSASMLKSVGAQYVVVGHSERRSYFNEQNEGLAEKVNQCLSNGLTPIYCCGELLEERESNNHFKIVESQINEGLFNLSESKMIDTVIAYEPVWAIGTGVTASPDQAQEMHAFIRALIAQKYNQQVADSISILYGGSCNPKNAKELFSLPDVDGGLIGGASLKSVDFMAIANSF
ncbi:triose-phosphate isomerase [Vicingus serpentipes]|uniref:Triosephosphate isomerase n=1 Tax=Vicingus serpentipes TaxID=1926625 RepID=A0A5C6RUF3_9FLAO|nr:triose-phosphate isomerase [Vicingus serpentipes]TXB65941.1 triose-phosphate isomerase [Vicingus serpentipes]